MFEQTGSLRGRIFLQRLLLGTALAAAAPAFAVTTVDLGNTVDLLGGVVSDTDLVLIDGNLINGQFNASNSFDVRKGSISATLFGFGTLTKSTAGIVTLSAANGYSGGTIISGGTLRVENSGALGLGNVTMTGSILDYGNGINISNPIVINSNTSQLQVLTGTATQSGVISETGGPRPLEKIGTGNLKLTAANTYTGLTTVTNGRLQLGTGGSIMGDVFVGPSSNAFFDFDQNNNYTYNGVLSGGKVTKGGTGTIEWTGTNTHTFTGIGDGTLLLSGSGTLGASNVTVSMSGIGPAPATLNLGGTTQNIGLLRFFQGWTQQVVNGTLNVSSQILPEQGTISANLGGTATLIKNTGGTAILSGTNSFTGATTINGGILVLQGGAALADTNAVTVNASGTLQLNASETIGRLEGTGSVDLGSSILTVDSGFSHTFAGVMSGTGGFNKAGGGHLTLTGANTYTGQTNINAGKILLSGGGELAGNVFVFGTGPNEFLQFDKNVDYTYGGVISGGNVSHTGTATTTWTGTNTHAFTGITAGTLKVAGTGTFGASNATVLMSGGILDLNGLTRSLGILTLYDGGNGLVTNGTVNVGSVIYADSGTFAANLTGTAQLAKFSPGSSTLSGTNTFTGNSTINAGTLILQGGSALANTNAVTVNSGGTLQLDASETIGSLTGAGNVALGLNTLTTGGDGPSTFSGVMSGAGGLVKEGASVFNLQGINTYSGGTTINGGTLLLGGASGAITGDVSVASGATLEFNRSNNLTFGGVISGAGTVKQNHPTGVITLTGESTLTGTMLVTNGTLAVSGAGTFGGATSVTLSASGSGASVDLGGTSKGIGSLNVDGGASIFGAAGSELSVSNTMTLREGSVSVDLSGSGDLVKDSGGGTNTVFLSGDNSYSGSTTIQGGTLRVSGGNAISDASAVDIFAGATLQLDSEETIGSIAGGGNLALTTKTLTTGGDNTDTLWTGTIFGGATSGLQKVGTGKMFVVGAMNQESTTVQAGELNFNGTALGDIAVNAGGRLSGNSTINGDLFNLGVVASGNSPGTTTVLGNYTGGGALEVEVQFNNAGAPVNGTTHDFLDIGGNVLGAPTTVNLLTFAPSGLPAATTGNGIEIVRVGGTSTAADFTMTSYLLGDYFYDLVYLSNYIGGTIDSFFLQSTLAVPGCVVDGLDNACFIDDAANTLGAAVDALGGNDTLQLTGTTDFTFDVARIGTTYTNFEVFQKADTNTVTLTGTMADANQGIDIQNGLLIAGGGTLGSNGRVNVFTPGTLQVASNLTVGSIAGSGDIVLGANTLTAGGDNTSTTFSGVISGTGDFEKQGSGTLTLSGANTFSGTLSLNEGRIDVTTGGTLGASTVDLFVQGTLDLGGTAQTVGSLFLGSGSIQSGSLTVNGDAGAQIGTISADLTVTGTLSVPFSFGSLTLSGNNTLTNVQIGAGELRADGEGAITDTASVNLAWSGIGFDPRLKLLTNQTVGSISSDALGAIDLGAFALTTGGNNASTTIAGGIFGAGGKLVKTGTGMLTLSGNNPFTGGIDLMQGGISLASNTAAGTGPITTFGSVISYANATNIATPIILNSNTTQLEVLVGSAEQSGIISEVGGSRPIEKIGVGNLTLSGANTYTGPTTITGGTLTAQGGAALSNTSGVIVAGGAALALNTSETIGSLSGAGALNMSGGTALTTGGDNSSTLFSGNTTGGGLTKTGSGNFTMSGNNNFGGPLNVNAGTLTAAAGSSFANTSALAVASNATAIFGATIPGTNAAGMTATNMGAISVAGTGTLYLDDNTSVGGSTLALAAGSNLNAFFTTNTATHAQITLSGPSNITNSQFGAYLDPLSFGSTVLTNFVYTNVISGGPVAGTFGSVSLLQTPSPLFSISAIYNPNSVDISITRASFASLPNVTTPNVVAPCAAIETIYQNGTTDPAILAAISALASATPAQAAAICASLGAANQSMITPPLDRGDRLTPEIRDRSSVGRSPGCTIAGNTWCLRRYAAAAVDTVTDIDPFAWIETGLRDSGTTSVWGRFIGAVGATNGDAGSPGSDHTTVGFVGGADRVIDSALLVGAAGVYTSTDIDYVASANTSNTQSVQLGGYFSYGGAETFLNGSASVIGAQSKSHRFFTVGLTNFETENFFRSWTMTGGLEAGTVIESDGFRFEPIASFSYAYTTSDSYQERGAGGLDLIISPEDSNSIRTALGARLSRVFDLGDRKLVPQLRVDWRHEWLDRSQKFSAAYSGAPGVPFVIEGKQMARDSLSLGLSATMPLTGQITGFVDADGSFSADARAATTSIGIRATW